MTATINPIDLQAQLAANPSLKLIDVRSPAEFNHQRAQLAVNVPLDQFDSASVIRQFDLSAGQPVFLICKMGGRSQKACNLLEAAGINSAVNVTGGTDRWVAEQLPAITTGKKPFAIMRQVQITAGGLVLLGIFLSFLHPGWLVLSAFIGAGLVFAGVSDTCAMGQMLGLMPWNRSASTNPPANSKPARANEAIGAAESESVSLNKPAPVDEPAECDSGG